MKKLILLFVFAVSLICCEGSSTNSSNSGETRIDLITGINIQSSIDGEPIQLGNPNINSDNTIQIFPNPSSFIYVLAQNPISNVWLLPCDAQKIYQDVDFGALLNAELYTEDEIDTLSVFKLSDENTTEVLLELESLEEGYYKLFMKINGSLYWNNIFVTNGNTNIEDIIAFWE